MVAAASAAASAATKGLSTVAGGLIGTGIQTGGNILSTLLTNRANRKLQEKAWAREDTAVQRRAADLKAAGINPLLAAGQAAQSSSPIQLKAPEIGDFGGAFISGRQAAQQAKYQAEQMRLQGLVTGQSLSNMKIDYLQKIHDLALNVSRGTRSNDSGMFNQIVSTLDAVRRLYEGNKGFIDEKVQKAGQVTKDAARGVGDAVLNFTVPGIIGKKIYTQVRKKQYEEQGKAVPDDPWMIEARKKQSESRRVHNRGY